MEYSLRKYYIFFVLFTLCGCRHYGPYVTYAPVKEQLSFINSRVCIYTRYDINDGNTIAAIDTCLWKYNSQTNGYITLYKNENRDTMKVSTDMLPLKLNFVYDICPTWYNIEQSEFKQYVDYKSPLFQDFILSLPLGLSKNDRARIYQRMHPTFAVKYGNHSITNDTIINYGSYILWLRGSCPPLLLFATGKQLKGYDLTGEIKDGLFDMVTNSYEYVNYNLNYKKTVNFDLDSIIGKCFSYPWNSHKKESLLFINDSVCLHSISDTLVNATSLDTCRYTIRENLIGIDLIKGKPCDTLSYRNNMLFYSKVYKDNLKEEYKHIVKIFIDETHDCANKTDSINMIMSTYFNTYVPLNLYNK